MSGFGCPLCWYYYGLRRRFRVMATVPYGEWLREIGRRMERGEVILLGGLMIERAMDGKVKIAVEEKEVRVDG